MRSHLLPLLPLILLPTVVCYYSYGGYYSLAHELISTAKQTTFDISDWGEVTSWAEIADTIVEDLRVTYGIEYTVVTDTYLINKEVHAFLRMPKKERLELLSTIESTQWARRCGNISLTHETTCVSIGYTTSIMEGTRNAHTDGPFVFFMDLLKKLKAIKKKELERPDIHENEVNILTSNHNGDFFLVYIFHIKSIAKLVKRNRALFERLNLVTEEAIQEQIRKTSEAIIDKWFAGQEPMGRDDLFDRLEEAGYDRKAIESGEMDILGNRLKEEL